MSKTLDAAIRYRIINSCLINKFKKFPTKQELQDACEKKLGFTVSERTIDKDLNEMRYNDSLGYFAPIEFDRKTKGYYYTDENYSIDKIPIGRTDLNAIEFAVEILGQYKNVSILNDFKGAVNKIVDTVKVQRILYDEPSLNGLIQLDIMDNIPGSEHLNDLVEGLKSRYICTLFYKKFGSEESKEYQFEPYMLKEFDALWYVTGKLSDTENYRTFALDRIQKVVLSNTLFIVNKDFDRQIYYNSVYGVTHINELPSKVVLKVDQITARFLSIRPIHKSQSKIKATEEFVWFEINLVLNPEIETKLMSLGNGCVVESPLILKNSIKDKLKKALENYE